MFMIESLLCYHFHILVGIFHYRTWLVYSNDGLPQIALGLCEQVSWMQASWESHYYGKAYTQNLISSAL